MSVNETYLGYIQNVIARMGQNSFHAKQWCITLVCAIFIFYMDLDGFMLQTVCFGAGLGFVLLFWLFDSYYLYLERCYRKLYNDVAFLNFMQSQRKDYDMRLPAGYRGQKEYWSAAFSKVMLFYVGIILLLSVVYIFTAFLIV